MTKENNFKKGLAHRSTTAGFTLVESLVAISIFSISLVAVMVILGRGISDTGYVKKKITAEFLAQEGIEYMRNIRDTYVLFTVPAQTGWTNFNSKLTTASCQTANGCWLDDLSAADFTNPAFQITSLALGACSGANGACPSLLYDSNTGKYSYSSGTNSGFIRRIRAISVNPNETQILSTVFWAQGSGRYNITFSENLFNWVE